MKKIIAVGLLVLASTPAFAISAHYRAQLDRSGCTEMNAGVSCNIHRTAAQNGVISYNHPAAKQREIQEQRGQYEGDYQLKQFLEDKVYGEYLGPAAGALSRIGFKPVDANVFVKGSTSVVLKLDNDSRVVSATIGD